MRILMVYPIVYELLKDQQGITRGHAAHARPTFTGVPPKKGKHRWVGAAGWEESHWKQVAGWPALCGILNSRHIDLLTMY